MGIAEHIEQLREIQANRESNYVERFERVLASVAEMHDPRSIAALTEFLDDDAEFDELMFSIIHTIEVHDDETYCQELLGAAPELCRRSPKWASVLFTRVLNSDSARKQLASQLGNASISTKDALRDLMAKINERGSEFVAKTTPIIIAANLRPTGL